MYALGEMEIDAAIRFDYYMVKSDLAEPAVLVYPILVGDNIFAKRFARYFARHDLCCALIHRKVSIAEAGSLEDIEAALEQDVADSKIVVDWLLDRPEVDNARIGAFGISMGGVKSALVKCLDSRVGPAVIALAGGSLAEVLALSREPRIKRIRKRIMTNEGMDLAEFRQRADAVVRADPLKLAQHVDASEIRMFVALFDRIVPTSSQFRLWRAFGQPERSILPSGHFTSALALPYGMWQSLRFFQRKFGMT